MTRTIQLIGLPTDVNSSFERGPAAAPAAIRTALWSERGNLACENGMEAGFDFELDDTGDLPLTEVVVSDDQLIEESVNAAVSSWKTPLCMGGDHAVTFPILKAIAAHHGPVDILHFDAHPDTYHDFSGNPRSHASPFARIMEAGLASRLVQVGIRTMNRHCGEQAERFGIETFEMRDFAVDAIPILARPTYISLDLDGIDPSQAPGVSHPEPGGLAVRDVLKVLDRVHGPIVGADIVELNPRNDLNDVTAILAAKFVREIAARMTVNGGTA